MKFENLLPLAVSAEQLKVLSPLKPFAKESLAFVEQLSLSLMRSPVARTQPELTALAFWMRKSNIDKLRLNMKKRAGDALLTPRGTIFHIAPSNVDTIFVYSWFLSLLVGNRNIVRLSSKDSPQTNILIETIKKILSSSDHVSIAQRNILVKYKADEEVTSRFSSVCDARVIWGGNETVQQVRQIALPPTAIDVAFANKYSIAIIKSQGWISASEANKQKWVEAFYNDAYWFDQMACSSPRLVLWIGSEADAKTATDDFWRRLSAIITLRHERFSDADYINKLVATNNLAIAANISTCNTNTNTNDLVRIWLDKPELHVEHHCGAGLFFEACLQGLTEIRPLLDRSVQTATYAGFTSEELRSFVNEHPIAGIDRIVPFGHALDFAPVWDGFDLLRVFMREITVS